MTADYPALELSLVHEDTQAIRAELPAKASGLTAKASSLTAKASFSSKSCSGSQILPAKRRLK